MCDTIDLKSRIRHLKALLKIIEDSTTSPDSQDWLFGLSQLQVKLELQLEQREKQLKQL